MEVHRDLGPGLLESTYQQCLAHELYLQGIEFEMEAAMPVQYKGIRLDCGYRIDFLLPGQLNLELKAVASISPIHRAQILAYMKLAGIETGLLINCNVNRLADGIARFKLGASRQAGSTKARLSRVGSRARTGIQEETHEEPVADQLLDHWRF